MYKSWHRTSFVFAIAASGLFHARLAQGRSCLDLFRASEASELSHYVESELNPAPRDVKSTLFNIALGRTVELRDNLTFAWRKTDLSALPSLKPFIPDPNGVLEAALDDSPFVLLPVEIQNTILSRSSETSRAQSIDPVSEFLRDAILKHHTAEFGRELTPDEVVKILDRYVTLRPSRPMPNFGDKFVVLDLAKINSQQELEKELVGLVHSEGSVARRRLALESFYQLLVDSAPVQPTGSSVQVRPLTIVYLTGDGYRIDFGDGRSVTIRGN